MTRNLLDTNIVSNMVRPRRHRCRTGWRDSTASASSLRPSASPKFSAASLNRPRACQRRGEKCRKRADLERWFSSPESPQAVYAGPVLPFDANAALIWRGWWPMAVCGEGTLAPARERVSIGGESLYAWYPVPAFGEGHFPGLVRVIQ